MERETTALVYLNCLLVKQDVRPGYIPGIPGIAGSEAHTGAKNMYIGIASKNFHLNTFLFGDNGKNLLITKDELSPEDKADLLKGIENPRYHTILGNILGYECVDFFGPHIPSIARTSIGFTISLINSDKKLQLFSYVCPGNVENSQVTLSSENIQRGVEYVNKIKDVFRMDHYARIVVSKISMEVTYLYPFPRYITREDIAKHGLPPIPPVSISEISVSEGGSRKYRKTKRKRSRHTKERKSKNKSRRRI